MVAEEVLGRLKQGNERFVRGESRTHYLPEERAAVAAEPHPTVVLVGCSDSRVPLENIFDVGVGDAWVVRTAGHVLSDPGLVSVRFGVEEWHIPLVVVVGHEDCLVVSAAVDGESPAWLEPILEYIDGDSPPVADDAGEQAPLINAVDEHVKASVVALKTYLKAASPAAQTGVVGCTYSPATGAVRWLT
jgi:carbonic anhydrase